MNRNAAPSMFLSLLIAFLTTVQVSFADPIRFARTPDISPNGTQVAFSYAGDIWTVPADGGTARLVTMHQAHEYRPLFSPDGKQLAFAGKRHGQYDVYVISVKGGRPTRLTFHSSNDYPSSWSHDGKHILFASTRAVEYPARYDLYKVPVTGGRVERVTHHEAREGAYSPDGAEIAYMRGPGTWYRKGYRGSANDEIWIGDADDTNHRRLTRFDGMDSYPQWSPDRKYLYYVSDRFGKTANIVRQEMPAKAHTAVNSKEQPKQITNHTDDNVRRARLSGNGEWLVYEKGADLWLTPTNGGAPRQLKIDAYVDDKTNPVRHVTYTSGASEFAVSPETKVIAFVVHGEIFLIPRSGGRAKRVTRDSARDHGLSWAPDSKSLIFLSDRNGQEDLYILSSADPRKPYFHQTSRYRLKRLTNTPEPEIGAMFSPDGKRISFIREGQLLTMKPDGSDLKTVVAERRVIDYDWSPDSKWISFARVDAFVATEMYIVPADGPTATEPIRNVTRYATLNAFITWSKKGHKLAFLSERGLNADRNVYVMSLQRPTVRGAKKTDDFDWQDLHRRVRRLSSKPASRAAINADGTYVAFRSTDGGGDDLWLAKTDGSNVKRLTTGKLKPTQLQWSGLLSTLLYFRDGEGKIRALTVSNDSTALTIPFIAKMNISREQEYQQIFDHSWRAVHENFYDKSFHGVDWKAVKARYRPLVKHIVMREDFDALISLMLGELNASHLGIRDPSPARPDAETAHLGLLLDDTHTGPGLKIKEVVRRGPADQRGFDLKPGNVVLAINGVVLNDRVNVAQLLNGKSKEAVVLDVVAKVDRFKMRRRLAMKLTTRKVIAALMYDRWIDDNARRVADLSKNRLGYIHIPNMSQTGLERFVRSLYSDNFDKEALVLDVRFNGGGYTHDKVLNYLGGSEHTFFVQRHGDKGLVMRSGDRKWSRPVILLINNRSFSDAEIFPHAFRTMKLGKLVGQRTGGKVIGTSTIKLIDGSTFRTPRTGVITAGGINLENEGVKPDVHVENHPDELARDHDAQIAKAVEVLLHDMSNAKKTPGVAANKTNPRATSPGNDAPRSISAKKD